MARIVTHEHTELSTVELLVVFFIIAVVAMIVLTALNPKDRQADARDAQRIVDMNALLTAVHSYVVDTDGELPKGVVVGTVQQIGTCISNGSTFCEGASEVCVDISDSIAPYLDLVPTDPLLKNDPGKSGYSIAVTEHGVVTITACGAETSSLQVSR